MAKASDVVSSAVRELTADVKEIKQSDEEDLGKLSELFHNVAQKAYRASSLLFNADEALSGEGNQVEPEEGSEDEAGTDEPEAEGDEGEGEEGETAEAQGASETKKK